ncbi:MAG: sigma-54-dependent Fis family transcriptional regulator [Planctomycetaceae bacterium]|nr:sigma-54-dependent Fis family transcriptional regulator [Planctomycetaceae bacterium]
MAKLLVVDDEQAICWGIRRLGEKMGHTVLTASSAEQGLECVRTTPVEVIILDVRLPGIDGLSAMEQFRKLSGPVPIIVITAFGDLHTAVQAVRNGAFEYLVKPFDVERVRQVLTRAIEGSSCTAASDASITAVEGFVGHTPVMQQAFNQIALAAASDASVLLQGESGTGKELAARAIHKYSARSHMPFVVVNVAALSSTLAESELFGHVKGAFTGADQSREGLLVRAHQGTLFLDEIADIPVPTQVKLLRALEHGEVTPVGADSPVQTDFRVISASHQDLLARVQQGTFRHDLYFRISAFRITLPPLRERREDIVPLSEYFLEALCRGQTQRCRLSAAACRALETRDWYGNVRELRNAIEHAVIVARGGTIMPEHLPAVTASPAAAAASDPDDIAPQIHALLRQWTASRLAAPHQAGDLYNRLLALVEPPVMQLLLERHAGQCAAAARILGLHRTTLRKKIDQYRLDGRGPDEPQ